MHLKKWIDDNFFITPIINKKNIYRIKYLEIIANKIYNEYNEYFLLKENAENISILKLLNQDEIELEKYKLIFNTKEELIEYLNSNLAKIDEYLSINLINWLYNYEEKFINKTRKTCFAIINDLLNLFPLINIPDIDRKLFLIEYIDYYLTDFLFDKNINFLESTLLYELKSSILALLTTYIEQENFSETKKDIIELGNPIKLYEKLYKVNIVVIINKLTENY